MKDEYEVYGALDRMLPGSVSRGIAESAVNAGEPESGIADLLDEAYGDGFLTDEIITFIRSELDGGPAIEVLDGLAMLEAQNSVA